MPATVWFVIVVAVVEIYAFSLYYWFRRTIPGMLFLLQHRKDWRVMVPFVALTYFVGCHVMLARLLGILR